MTYDVYGMCNPLFDIQAEISDALLSELGYEKGGMFLIDAEQQKELVSKIYPHIVNTEPGGSGANTVIGLAQLGGTAAYTGKVAADEHGTLYIEGLTAKGIRLGAEAGQGTTGISVILITPDAQRTMCTFLGICRELSPEDVNLDLLRESRCLYVTSYLWDTDTQKAAVLKAMKAAKEAGLKVVLSLSDPFCVGRHKDELKAIIETYVDVLIGNKDEAQQLTDTDTPYAAAQALSETCELVAVTLDAKGSLLQSKTEAVEVPVYSVTPVDTTGAGDMYAAGLLYGLTHGLPLAKTGALASYVAAQVVGQLGPRVAQLNEIAIANLLA